MHSYDDVSIILFTVSIVYGHLYNVAEIMARWEISAPSALNIHAIIGNEKLLSKLFLWVFILRMYYTILALKVHW